MVVLGIGNPYVTDDGIGVHVLHELRRRVKDERITFAELTVGGIGALECLKGFEEAIILDAAKTGKVPIGHLWTLSPLTPSPRYHPLSLHTIGLQSAFLLGSMLGFQIPKTIALFAVEVADVETFHEGCTPEVEASIPVVATQVIDFLKSRIPDLQFSSRETEEARSS